MPDQATMKWEAALELLAASGELGPGKVSVLRMTRVIDVDGVHRELGRLGGKGQRQNYSTADGRRMP